MAVATGKKGGIKNDINVTPLVDVVLVLLIIFMVVTPMLQRGKDVELPQAAKTEEEGEGKADPLILSITAEREVFVESDAVDPTGLQNRLQTELATNPGKRLLLKGDKSLAFGDVRQVLKVARDAGAKGVALGVQVEN